MKRHGTAVPGRARNGTRAVKLSGRSTIARECDATGHRVGIGPADQGRRMTAGDNRYGQFGQGKNTFRVEQWYMVEKPGLLGGTFLDVRLG